MALDRRSFLQRTAAGVGAMAAMSMPRGAWAQQAEPGPGPYGSIEGIAPDGHGLIVPPGFSSRVIAVSGRPVAGTAYRWPAYPDGAACFPTGEGGWDYVCNSEVVLPRGLGGASRIRFSPDATIVEAGAILTGSSANCAGGPTPWGSWLSCEEFDTLGAPVPEPQPAGLVWETDPRGTLPAVARPAMGLLRHEACAVDPVDRVVYMTEDQRDGLLYRFAPAAYPDLTNGLLEAALVAPDGSVGWLAVPDPSGQAGPLRSQVSAATRFAGGEGLWHHDGVIFFTTKHDARVHAIHLREQRYELVYDARSHRMPVLDEVDNVTVHAGSGDVYVAEDGSDPLELVLISPEREVAAFCRLDMAEHRGSEITGPCFSPDGTRLYFSSQRGGPEAASTVIGSDHPSHVERRAGVTFEVSGPFRGAAAPVATASPGITPAPRATSEATEGDDRITGSSGNGVPAPTDTISGAAGEAAILREEDSSGEAGSDDFRSSALIGLGAAAAVIAGAAAWRARGHRDPNEEA